MLEPRELRIGNYIIVSSHINGGYVTKTESFDSMNEFFNLYSPIPLTEEWLVKFGLSLEQRIGTVILFEFSQDFKCTWDSGVVFLEEYNEGEKPLHHIKYVHQLQNLYFALTGTELELKQEVKKWQ